MVKVQAHEVKVVTASLSLFKKTLKLNTIATARFRIIPSNASHSPWST